MSNSACERFHSYLKTSLRTYVKDDQSDWPDLLPGILMAYRMTPAMRSTEYSPYYLLFGIQPTLPLDTTLIPKPSLSAPHKVRLTSIIKNLQVARTIAKENIERNLSKNKTLYDRKAEAPDFTIGDLVLLFTPKVPIGHAAKLHRQWSGPWYIADMGPNNTYRLRHSVNHKESKSLIHANRLKHFHTPEDRIYHPTQDPQVPANDIDEEDADDRDLIHNTQNDDLGLRLILDDHVDDDAATDDNDNTDDNDTNDANNVDNADHDNDNTDHNDDHDDKNDAADEDPKVSDKNKETDSRDSGTWKEIEKILHCAYDSHRKTWYRVKLVGEKNTQWLREEVVPQVLKREFHIHRTREGRVRKKGRKQKTYFMRQ